jgi:hypothetical protein
MTSNTEYSLNIQQLWNRFNMVSSDLAGLGLQISSIISDYESKISTLDQDNKNKDQKIVSLEVKLEEVTNQLKMYLDANSQGLIGNDDNNNVVREDTSEEIVREDTSEEIVREDTSEEIVREDTTEEIVREDTTEEIVREDTTEEIVREDTSEEIVREDKSEEIVREDTSEEIVREDTSEEIVREDTTEEIVREDASRWCNSDYQEEPQSYRITTNCSRDNNNMYDCDWSVVRYGSPKNAKNNSRMASEFKPEYVKNSNWDERFYSESNKMLKDAASLKWRMGYNAMPEQVVNYTKLNYNATKKRVDEIVMSIQNLEKISTKNKETQFNLDYYSSQLKVWRDGYLVMSKYKYQRANLLHSQSLTGMIIDPLKIQEINNTIYKAQELINQFNLKAKK